jgi:YD repeat-containing protein
MALRVARVRGDRRDRGAARAATMSVAPRRRAAACVAAAALAACGTAAGTPRPWEQAGLAWRPASAEALRTASFPAPEGTPELGESVDLAEGRLRIGSVDLELPGNGGFDLRLVRVWRGGGPIDLGPRDVAPDGWHVHFGRVLAAGDGSPCADRDRGSTVDNPVLETPEGRRVVFAHPDTAGEPLRSEDGWRLACTPSGAPVATAPDGLRIEFGQRVPRGAVRAWYATRLEHGTRQWAEVRYASVAAAEPVSLVASDGRSLRLDYAPADGRRVLVGATAGDGRAWRYEHAGGRLVAAVRPDGGRWRYRYANGADASGVPLLAATVAPGGGERRYDWTVQPARAGAPAAEPFAALRARTLGSGSRWSLEHAPAGGAAVGETIWRTPVATLRIEWVRPQEPAAPESWTPGLVAERELEGVRIDGFAWRSVPLSAERDAVAAAAGVPGAIASAVRLAEFRSSVDGIATDVRHEHDAFGRVTGTANDGGPTVRLRYDPADAHAGALPVEVRVDDRVEHRVERSTDGARLALVLAGMRVDVTTTPDGDVVSAARAGAEPIAWARYRGGVPELRSEGVRTVARTFDANGRVVTESIGESGVARFAYDAAGRLSRIDCPGCVTAARHEVGAIAIDCAGVAGRVELDEFGRIALVASGAATLRVGRDAAGRIVSLSRGAGAGEWTYAYDAADRPVEIGLPDGRRAALDPVGVARVLRGDALDAAHRAWLAAGAGLRAPPPLVDALRAAGVRADPSALARLGVARDVLGSADPIGRAVAAIGASR